MDVIFSGKTVEKAACCLLYCILYQLLNCYIEVVKKIVRNYFARTVNGFSLDWICTYIWLKVEKIVRNCGKEAFSRRENLACN